jgi:hypothetical protein
MTTMSRCGRRVGALAVGCVGGGISGGKFYIWGIVGYNKPIWDVLALEGVQEEALNRLRTGSISPGFPIRQAVPLGLAQAQNCCWARWARFFIEKNVYCSKYSIFVYILLFSK